MGSEAVLGPEADRIAVIQKALSSGVTLLDTADLYGPYTNHILIGTVHDLLPAPRARTPYVLL